jgi:hypothetical protein
MGSAFSWAPVLERAYPTGSRIRTALTKSQRPLFLRLGSGPRGIEDANWVNVDGFRDKNVDCLVDFGRSLLFPNESFAS